MKLGTRISLGFGSVVALTAALGLVAFLMFSKVSTEVYSLTGHHLPAVRSSTGVERSAFEAILEEKSYILKPSDKTHEKAKERIKELLGNLDKVGEIARLHADLELAKKEEELRRLAKEWATLFEGVVATTTETAALEETMRVKGREITVEADQLFAQKDKDYQVALQALNLATAINTGAYSARMNIKAFMLYGEARFMESSKVGITGLLKNYEDLEKLISDPVELTLVKEARRATQRFATAAKDWEKSKAETSARQAEMDQLANSAADTIAKFMEAKEKELQTFTLEADRNAGFKLGASLAKISVAIEKAENLMRQYMLTKAPEAWDAMEPELKASIAACAALRPTLRTEEDRRVLSSLEALLSKYLAAAKNWSADDDQLLVLAVDMDDAAEGAGRAVENFVKTKTAAVKDITQTVLLATNISKLSLNIRLASRRYMMTLDTATWTTLTSDLAKVQSLYPQIKGLLNAPSERSRVDKSLATAKDYLTLSIAWKEKEQTLREKTLPALIKLGDAVLETAVQAETEAWKMSDLGSGRVQSISAGSRTFTTSTTFIVLLAAGVIAAFIIRSIVRPLQRSVDFSAQVAQGDLTHTLEGRGDLELRQLAESMNQMVEGLRTNISSISSSAQSLGSAAEELSAVSSQVSSNTDKTASQASVVSAAAEQVSKNIQTVATGTEEMGSSIREISKNTTEAARVANEAAQVATETNATVLKLGRSSSEIGDVIKVITSIASQTNLLALNATIEAARAGDAGKGFAVVANEVKELARQTATATEDIYTRIKSLQGDSQAAVSAIGRISEIIERINSIQSVIASSVEEQSATTNEISRNISEASKGASEIAGNIHSVTQAAQSTTEGANQTASSAQELARLAGDLKQIVAKFRLTDS